eukprot:CCRYP_013722-RA/>CCRYP_013722-RA protein AED:0.36 eAED:0.36 QI:31/1/1/1/0/0/2/138/67
MREQASGRPGCDGRHLLSSWALSNPFEVFRHSNERATSYIIVHPAPLPRYRTIPYLTRRHTLHGAKT